MANTRNKYEADVKIESSPLVPPETNLFKNYSLTVNAP